MTMHPILILCKYSEANKRRKGNNYFNDGISCRHTFYKELALFFTLCLRFRRVQLLRPCQGKRPIDIANTIYKTTLLQQHSQAEAMRKETFASHFVQCRQVGIYEIRCYVSTKKWMAPSAKVVGARFVGREQKHFQSRDHPDVQCART